MPKLIAFDLDDTLAPSKSPLPRRIAELLAQLLDHVDVAVISGGRFEQFEKQVIGPLSAIPSADRSRLHLMPTCGTQYYRFDGSTWVCRYSEDLTAEQKERSVVALTTCATELGLWAERPWGAIIEDRGSQITYSALGQEAPIEAKAAWDPTSEKKNALRQAVAAALPELEVRAGGTTSIDITRQGIDKAYGMRRLADETGLALDDMLFVGDRLDPDGNDYPVKRLGVPTHAVTGWSDTADYLTGLIPRL